MDNSEPSGDKSIARLFFAESINLAGRSPPTTANARPGIRSIFMPWMKQDIEGPGRRKLAQVSSTFSPNHSI